MNPDNPANRKLLNTTLLVILAPLYAIVLFTPYTGVLWNAARYWSHGTPFALLLLLVFALGAVVSIVWLLWRGTLVGPIALLLIVMFTGMATTSALIAH